MSNGYVLQATGITKRFGDVAVLRDVDFELAPGEVNVLVGENGAGKSTLIKILSGVYTCDAGEILFDGRPVRIAAPPDAQALGIRVVYQEFSLVPTLTVAENMFLGALPRRGLRVDWPQAERGARELLARIGADIDPRTEVSRLSVAQRQMVEICRALAGQARVLVLDEPTAALTASEVDRLLDIVQQLKGQGVGIVYISHRMEEIRRVGDRITVLRDGVRVGTLDSKRASVEEVVELMVGRKVEDQFPARDAVHGAPVLRVDGLGSAGAFEAVSFTAHAGEVLGITGAVGSGGFELARALFGAHPVQAGVVSLGTQQVQLDSPATAIRHGIAYVPEDRKELGLMLKSSVAWNASLLILRVLTRFGILRLGRERALVRDLVAKLSVVTSSLGKAVRLLSGGNQQKVVIGRWLLRDSRLYLLAEPTRGVDVGAKQSIYELIRKLAKQGAAIVIVSSDLMEVRGIADRILVMRKGKIAGELRGEERTLERMLVLGFAGGTQGETAHARAQAA